MGAVEVGVGICSTSFAIVALLTLLSVARGSRTTWPGGTLVVLVIGEELGEITDIVVLIAIIVFGRIHIRIHIRIVLSYVRLIANIGAGVGIDVHHGDGSCNCTGLRKNRRRCSDSLDSPVVTST